MGDLRSGPPTNTRFLGPTRVNIPNGITSISFADVSGGRYTQSDSADARTVTVGTPIGVYYMWVHIGTTRRIRLNRPCAAAMRPYVKLFLPLVMSLLLVHLHVADVQKI